MEDNVTLFLNLFANLETWSGLQKTAWPQDGSRESDSFCIILFPSTSGPDFCSLHGSPIKFLRCLLQKIILISPGYEKYI